MSLIKPKPLPEAATIGVFSPSSPAYIWAQDVFAHAVACLEGLGYSVKLGELAASSSTQGYRSASGEARAAEFMKLVEDPDVDCLMATIGGFNSSSMIPYLNFDAIRESRKPIVGYSDVTSLQMAILHYSRLSTFYGPAVVPTFGEYPSALQFTLDSFHQAARDHNEGSREITAPAESSNHRRNWLDGTWKREARAFQPNSGWKTLVAGKATAELIVCNLNTLCSIAGCPFFPQLSGKIFLIEDEEAPMSLLERRLRQLSLMEVFEGIAALIVSKAERFDAQGAPFSLEDLLLEILPRPCPFPVITNFDCGHTHPMLTLAQGSRLRLSASGNGKPELQVLEPMIAS